VVVSSASGGGASVAVAVGDDYVTYDDDDDDDGGIDHVINSTASTNQNWAAASANPLFSWDWHHVGSKQWKTMEMI